MKKRFLLSLIVGFILLAVSLFYKTGSKLEPMPYMGDDFPLGIRISTPEEVSLTKRGFPLAIVSIESDMDEPGEYYKSVIVSNFLLDYLLFVIVSFTALTLLSYPKKKNK